MKKVKELYKEFGLTAGMQKGALTEGRKIKKHNGKEVFLNDECEE